MRAPSGENATEVTGPACPSKVRSRLPLAASQSLTVWSSLPETMRTPSGENATDLTWSECPLKVRSSLPLAASQSLIGVVLARRGDAGAVRRERDG